MKKLLLALSIAVATCLGLQAQSAPSVLQKIYVDYDLNRLSPKGADGYSLNGAGIGYAVDFRVSQTLPVYVGTGLNFTGLWHSRNYPLTDELDDIRGAAKDELALYNFNIPLNVGLRVPLSDGLYLTPQLGLDLRIQVSGKKKFLLDDVELWSTNVFKDDETGDEAWNRVQFGWHAGMNLQYQMVSLGLSFGTDFAKLHKNLGGSNFLVSVGYVF